MEKSQKTKLAIAGLSLVLIIVLAMQFAPQAPNIGKEENNKTKFNDTAYADTSISEENSVFDWYNYAILDGISKRFNEEPQSIETQKMIYEGIKKSFERECTTENFESCSVYKTLMPYCQANSAFREIETKNAFENIAFSNSVNHWRQILTSDNLTNRQLEDFYGLTIIEKWCGQLNKDQGKATLQKITQLPANQAETPEKEIEYSILKISIAKQITGTENISGYFPETGMPSKEKMKTALCTIQAFEKIAKSNDVCAVSYYFRSKNFCEETQGNTITKTEQELAEKFLANKYTDFKKLHCQFDIFLLSN